MQLTRQMLGAGTSRGRQGSQGAALFSHLPLGYSGSSSFADAFARLMEGVGESPWTSPGITIHETIEGVMLS